MIFGRLDRYLARSFVEPFLVATAVIVGLYIVGDAFGSLDEYLREADGFFVALGRMASIYALRTPSFLALVLPISMLVGSAYGISRLSARNEIMAMKASGLSFWRVLAPVYAMAVLIAGLAFANREMLVPRVERAAAPDMQSWKGKSDKYERIIGYLEEEHAQYTMLYNVVQRKGRKLLVVIEPPGGPVTHFLANDIVPAKGGWQLSGVTAGAGEAPGDFWRTSLRRRDVETHLLPPESWPIKLLRRAIKNAEGERERRVYVMYYHLRLAYPFSGIVLVALGVPFVIGHERVQRSRMLGVGVCVGICMVFYTVQFVAKDLGLSGRLMPAVAAWLPNVIFAGLGLYLLETVHE
jgi:LPS export ABC transporter permease LptG